MFFLSVLLVYSAYHCSIAVDLNIYKSVTEIRKFQNGVGEYEYYFRNSEYADIVEGSIGWDGTSFVKQVVYNSIDLLQNALVTVNLPNACKCKTIQAKIIDPNTMLLQNLDTKGYFYADSRSLEYTSAKPDEGGKTLRFEFKSKTTNYNGTLSYLMRGITWSPSYDLLMSDSKGCNLRSYATISNNQQQQYQVENTNLYSGDIQLANSYTMDLPYRSMAKGAMVAAEAAPSIQLEGEQKGFYFYSLNDKYTLRPKSSIRLPFVSTNVQCKFYYQTTTSISMGSYDGVFQRNYDLTPDQFLPAGILTIRDNQVLIGQSNLPDIPKNYTQTVMMGADSDVRYEINGNLTSTSKDPAKSWQKYELDIEISNHKEKDVNGRLDFYGAVQTIIDDTSCESSALDDNMIHLPFEIEKGGRYRCRMDITLSWG